MQNISPVKRTSAMDTNAQSRAASAMKENTISHMETKEPPRVLTLNYLKPTAVSEAREIAKTDLVNPVAPAPAPAAPSEPVFIPA